MIRFSLLLSLIARFSARDEEPLVTVHLVPHTHDDVGWLKTIDQYYSGQNNSIQNANVHMILDTVVRGLSENPNRTFTYVEQAFFQRWWRRQSDAMRSLTRKLVKSGQLEFSNGGWCMHDEAATFYMDMIDQTTLGHKMLMEEFEVSPTTGWQLDPFGHSATQAALLSAEAGFTGIFFGRIDYQDLELRKNTRSAEFIWRASPSLGPDAQIFTSLTGQYSGSYAPPIGFDFDQFSIDDPVQDDPDLEDRDVKSKVNDFVKLAVAQANQTRGKNILWTMGSDFEYGNAFVWFENLDKLIKHVNKDGRVRAMYSTPSMYVEAKRVEQIVWPLEEHDFFPYGPIPHNFLTGYFTSRPTLKRYIRESGAFLRATQQMSMLAGRTSPDDLKAVHLLWDAQAIAQHHDAVTGTSKQHVAFDYAKRLAKGRAAAARVASASIRQLAGAGHYVVCDLRNISVCTPTQSVGVDRSSVCIAVWNGLGQPRREVIELPVSTANVQVKMLGQNEHLIQLTVSLPSVTNYGQDGGGSNLTVLVPVDLPALGFVTLCLEKASEPLILKSEELQESDGIGPVLENENIAVKFCGGHLCEITNKQVGLAVSTRQSWLWYQSADRSDAYVFRPNTSEAHPISNRTPSLRLIRGPVADEVHQAFGPWVSQRVRLFHDASHVEVTYTVMEIPVEDGVGKEIISRISTDIENAGECFTDSNGREMLRRKRDFRYSWKLNQTEPIAGNYYPVTTSLFIRDSRAQLTVLTDASQGGTGCVRDGQVELMVHRRVLNVDHWGAGEPLNETEYVTPYVPSKEPQGVHYGRGLVVRGKHVLHAGVPERAAKSWRVLQDQLQMPPVLFFATDTQSILNHSLSAIHALPPNVQLVSLAQWSHSEVLVRLAHQFGEFEDEKLSLPVEVDMEKLFVDRRLVEVSERGLTGTISRKQVLERRIPWHIEDEALVGEVRFEKTMGFRIRLGPLQVRTFLLKFGLQDSDEILV